MVLFFILAAIAATGAMLPCWRCGRFPTEKKNYSRVKATLLTSGLLALIGSTAALSNSTLSGVTLFGMTFFDLYDYLTSNILLPVGGLFIALCGLGLGVLKRSSRPFQRMCAEQ